MMDVPVDPWTAEDVAFWTGTARYQPWKDVAAFFRELAYDQRCLAGRKYRQPMDEPPAWHVIEYDNPYPVWVRVLLALGLGILGWGVVVGLDLLLARIAA